MTTATAVQRGDTILGLSVRTLEEHEVTAGA